MIIIYKWPFLSKIIPVAVLGSGSKICWLGGGKMAKKLYSSDHFISYLREEEMF